MEEDLDPETGLNTKEKEAIRVSRVTKEKGPILTPSQKERYFGGERKKRKIRRMNERKFVFDWDAGEDTSQDFNPLYANRHSAQMFGRGHIAGVDDKEQKKQRSEFYNSLLRDRQSAEEKERALYVFFSFSFFFFSFSYLLLSHGRLTLPSDFF